MGQDQGDLDIPVLLEVRHFLDQTAKNPPEGIENSGSRADTKFP
jgi:hypothetical protein